MECTMDHFELPIRLYIFDCSNLIFDWNKMILNCILFLDVISESNECKSNTKSVAFHYQHSLSNNRGILFSTTAKPTVIDISFTLGHRDN